MAFITVELENLYNQYFGTKPKIGAIATTAGYEKPFDTPQVNTTAGFEKPFDSIKTNNPFNDELITSKKGSVLRENYLGVEIWLPIKLWIDSEENFYLPYSVVRITGSQTIIRTALAEHKGTVKEIFNTDDYKIIIKGFLIDKEQRLFPEDDLYKLKKYAETGKRIHIENALTDIFLEDAGAAPEEQNAVVITSFELPEVEGGKKHVRPFVMQLESDNVFTLEAE
jgi:hypothetical protein